MSLPFTEENGLWWGFHTVLRFKAIYWQLWRLGKLPIAVIPPTCFWNVKNINSHEFPSALPNKGPLWLIMGFSPTRFRHNLGVSCIHTVVCGLEVLLGASSLRICICAHLLPFIPHCWHPLLGAIPRRTLNPDFQKFHWGHTSVSQFSSFEPRPAMPGAGKIIARPFVEVVAIV